MKQFYFILLLVFVYVSGNSQTVINLNESGFEHTQELSEQQRSSNAYFESARRARPFELNHQIKNHQNLQVGYQVNLQLFDNASHPATIQRKVTDINGVTALTLKLNNFQYAYAYISLSPNSYLVTVDIPELSEKYSSQSGINQSISYMLQLDESEYQNAGCGIDDEIHKSIQREGRGLSPETPEGIAPQPADPGVVPGPQLLNIGCHTMPGINDPATITIMIVYTQEAENWANANQGGILNAISNTLAIANQVSVNNNLGITFQLAHSAWVNYTEVNMGTDWVNLLTDGNGIMDEVHDLRRTHDADLVALLNYYVSGGIAGIANLLDSKYGNSRAAFSATRVNFAVNSNTFIHEIGHNMGANHHASQLDDPGPTNWENWSDNTWTAGWRWQGSDSNYYIDLMSYPASNQYGDGFPSFQIPYFSDPNHAHLGGVAGHPVQGDNARTLREIKHYIARYKETIDYCNAGNAPLYATTALYINNVTMGDISNPSGASSARYGDFTALTTCMMPGESQTLEIEITNSSSTRPVKVWIDWNDDKIFDPVTEQVYDSGTGASQHLVTITAPLGTATGDKRMRIRTYSTFTTPVVDTPCGYSGVGEVEDYSIRLETPPPCVAAAVPQNLQVGDITANTAHLSWDVELGIDYYELRYRETGTTDWETISSIVYPYYTIAGLVLSTEYEVQVRAVCSATPSAYTVSEIFTTLSYDYCISTSNSTASSFIQRVQLNTIDNISSDENGGYSDFTHISTNLEQGQTYTITITPEWTGTAFSKGYGVWIDYNFDGDFNGPSELIGLTTAINSNPTHSFQFTVPYGVVPGPTRMRVSAKQAGHPTACEIFANGEVEDYTVILGVNPPCTVATVPSNLSLQGTTQTTASLYWNGVAGALYDLRYKLISDSNWTTLSDLEFTEVTIEGLLLSQEYEAQVRSKCDGGASSAYSASFTFFVDYDYCSASLAAALHINRFRLETIDNTSGNAGYSNFSHLDAELQPGATYNFIINNNGNGSTHNFAYAAYIDYDYNGEFDVPAERVWNQTAINLTEVAGSFTVPANVTLNRVRLRIVMANTSNVSYIPPPCIVSTTLFGEIEDYTVIFVSCDEATVPENLVLDGLSHEQAILSWDAVPGAGFDVQYRETGAPSWTNINGITQNSVTIQSLNPATLYEARVRSDCDGTTSDYSSILVFETYNTPPSYCAAGATSTSFEKISNVTFNAINNNSTSTAGYEDFTHISTTVEKGETYAFSASFTGTSYSSDQVLVWIDFNQNGDFTDPGEEVLVTPLSTSPWTGNITIPAGALNGPTRMRVRLHDFSAGPNATPCGNSSYGQVEDYTVFIVPSGYVFQNGSWSPENPVGMSTSGDDIYVINGTTLLTGDLIANSLIISEGATLRTAHTVTLAGDVENDGELLLSSNDSSTGQLDTFTGNVSGTGLVTVERYIPARRAFRFLASSVTTTGSIRDNWQEGASNAADNPNPGYGTHITGSASGANGFDATPSGNPSLFTLNNFSQIWIPAPNTDLDNLNAGTPYRILIRGDRSIELTNNSATPTNTTLRTTGILHTGPFAVAALSENANAFNFIGNPYPAVVDMEAVLLAASNINSVHYWVWDPTLGGEPTPGQPGGRGAYVAVNVGDNTSNNPSSTANKYLQPGQAAFVQTIANGSASITFQENHKSVSQPQTQVFSILQSLRLKLFDVNSFTLGSTASDGLLLRFSDTGNNLVTIDDALKFYNQDENLASNNTGTLLSIESRALPQAGESIQLFTNQYRRTNYIFEARLTEMNDVQVFLKDNFTGILTELLNNDTSLYAFQVDSSIPASVADDRFEIVFEEMMGTNEAQFGDGFVLFPNPAQGEINIATRGIAGEEVQLSITGMLGQTVYNAKMTVSANGLLTLDTSGLSNGVYILKLNNATGGQFITKFIKK